METFHITRQIISAVGVQLQEGRVTLRSYLRRGETVAPCTCKIGRVGPWLHTLPSHSTFGEARAEFYAEER